jgi:2-polyprenyl-6-methoxyphenol hydroxylase-like FAD-dependent oxidoreductase
MRDRSPSLPWGNRRITLLGDSAHAMTPDLGQGACQAIESAVVLAQCLGESDNVERGLRAYEQRRFRRTSDVIRMSWLVAHSSSITSPTLGVVRDLGMRFGLRAAVMSQLDWLFAGPC